VVLAPGSVAVEPVVARQREDRVVAHHPAQVVEPAQQVVGAGQLVVARAAVESFDVAVHVVALAAETLNCVQPADG
jgi:hypothetical protein